MPLFIWIFESCTNSFINYYFSWIFETHNWILQGWLLQMERHHLISSTVFPLDMQRYSRGWYVESAQKSLGLGVLKGGRNSSWTWVLRNTNFLPKRLKCKLPLQVFILLKMMIRKVQQGLKLGFFGNIRTLWHFVWLFASWFINKFDFRLPKTDPPMQNVN